MTKNGQEKIARTSCNDYSFGISYNGVTGERIIRCSKKRELLLKQINYMTKGYHAQELGKNTDMYYSDQFVRPDKLRIVELYRKDV